MSVDIGIDLGTASVLVYVRGKGVVLKEPSVVAFDRDTNVIKAIGEEARLMLGRTPGNIVAVRPLRQGVISDYTVTEKMIKYFVRKSLGKRTFKKPRISICVPSGVTEVEKKAVEEATYAAGAREVHLIEEPVAARWRGVVYCKAMWEYDCRYRRRYCGYCGNLTGRHCCEYID